MNEKPYEYSSSNYFRYEFVSKSLEREINKAVVFSERENGVYNMALVDVLDDGSFSDTVVSNNGDFRAVMATVYKILVDFLNTYPNNVVLFYGNDEKRHRLYRIILSREIVQLRENLQIYGLNGGLIDEFYPNVDYEYYFITKK